MSLRIIQEYLQPKIGGKIRIFSLALENNILIKKKSVSGKKCYRSFHLFTLFEVRADERNMRARNL